MNLWDPRRTERDFYSSLVTSKNYHGFPGQSCWSRFARFEERIHDLSAISIHHCWECKSLQKPSLYLQRYNQPSQLCTMQSEPSKPLLSSLCSVCTNCSSLIDMYVAFPSSLTASSTCWLTELKVSFHFSQLSSFLHSPPLEMWIQILIFCFSSIPVYASSTQTAFWMPARKLGGYTISSRIISQ